MPEILRWWYRTLQRQTLLSSLALATLALGIAFSVCVFTVVDQVLLRPLPFPEPDRLAIAWSETGGNEQAMISVPDYLDLRARLQSFEHFAVNWSTGLEPANCVVGDRAQAVHVPCAGVSYNFFAALGVQPLLGRGFVESHENPANPKAALLSHRFWQTRFHADPSIVGRPIKIDFTPYTVIGVMPPEAELPEHTALWTPASFDAFFRSEKARGLRYVHPLGRLKPGISFSAAQAELHAILKTLPRTLGGERLPSTAALIPLHDALVRDTRTGLRVLLAASFVLLLILTSNLVNFVLATTLRRRREFAMRAVSGAAPALIRRQLLAECLLLSVVSGIAGLLVAYTALPLLLRASPVDLFRLGQVSVGLPAVFLTFLISVAIGLLAAIAPILATHRTPLALALKEGGRSGPRLSRRTAAALVLIQVALASLLLPAAASMLLSFRRLLHVDPGFNPNGVVTMSLFADLERRTDIPQLVQRTLDRIRQVPSVEAAAVSVGLPLKGWRSDLRFRLQPGDASSHTAHRHMVSREYFAAFQIPLRAGRLFLPADEQPPASAIIVNQEFAARFFPGRDPVGQRIFPESRSALEIAGVVQNVLSRGLDQPPYPAIYTPSLAPYELIVRAAAPPAVLIPALRSAVESVDPEITVLDITPMDDIVRASLARQRLWTLCLAAFSVLSLLFAITGVYGLVTYSVRRRLPEFGLRAALGARPRDQSLAVFRGTVSLTAAGAAIGLAASLAFAPRPELWLLAASAALILATSLLAAAAPARRAMLANPATLLRVD